MRYQLLALCLLAGALRAEDLIVDLKSGVITELKTSTSVAPLAASPTYNVASFPYAKVELNESPTCPGTPWEALVTLNLDPGNGLPPYSKVKFAVEFDGKPTGWTVHIGDDPANDGFGGGSSIQGVAELQLVDQDLRVYTTGLASGVVDNLYWGQLRNTDGGLRFVVGDQTVAIGKPRVVLNTANIATLFSIPDFKGESKLYAAFNRVISGRPDRRGCGASKILLSFE